MKWRIMRYKNLPHYWKRDIDKKRGLYIVVEWNKYLTSIVPFSIGSFIHVVLMKNPNY